MSYQLTIEPLGAVIDVEDGQTILAAALPYAIAKGWIPAGSADLVVSAGVAVLVAGWSVLSKPKKA